MLECHENLYAAAQLCEGEADGREMVGDGVNIKETEGRDQIEFFPLFLLCVSTPALCRCLVRYYVLTHA